WASTSSSATDTPAAPLRTVKAPAVEAAVGGMLLLLAPQDGVIEQADEDEVVDVQAARLLHEPAAVAHPQPVYPCLDLVVLLHLVAGLDPAGVDQLGGAGAQLQVPAAGEDAAADGAGQRLSGLQVFQDELAAEPADVLELEALPAGTLHVEALAEPAALELA